MTFTNNIVRHSGGGIQILGHDYTHQSEQTKRILVKNSLFDDIDGSKWSGSGRLLLISDAPADIEFDHNTAFQSGDITQATGSATTGFVFRNNITPHNLYGVGGDGTFGDPMRTLDTYFPGYIFVKNVLQGGDCSKYPQDNFCPLTWDEVQFVDRPGGNYRLGSTSPYKNAGTDGKDIGADIGALEAATAGVISGSLGENVIWANLVNVTANGNSLSKTSGCDGCADAGAVSQQEISSGDGYLEFTASETSTQRAIGLSNGNPGTSRAEIDFAIMLWADGGFDIRENDFYIGESRYAPGDVFRISVESGVVKFYQNGVLLYSSTQSITYPLLVDTSLWTLGSTVNNVRIVLSQ